MLIRDQWSQRDPYIVNTTPYTIVDNGVYLVDAAAGAIVINLPSATSADGLFAIIRKTDATINPVTITPVDGQTIEGSSTIALVLRYENTYITSKSGQWYSMDNFASTRQAAARASDANFSFFDASGGNDYAQVNDIGTYRTFATFLYRGTNVWSPLRFKVILSRSGATGTSNVRVLNSTSGLVICTISWTSITPTIYTTTSISNLPAGESIFQFQAMKSNSGDGNSRIHAAGLYP